MVIRMAGATGMKKERAEALLGHQALHDMLTGLPNRSCFYDRTEQAMRQGARDGSNSAVMLFDLDRFKEINDTLGHKYGDRVLTEVGPRIRRVLRDADTIARLGGDEFCVLLPRVDALSDALEVAERIISRPGRTDRDRRDGSRDRGQLRHRHGARSTGTTPTSFCNGPTWPCTWPRVPM